MRKIVCEFGTMCLFNIILKQIMKDKKLNYFRNEKHEKTYLIEKDHLQVTSCKKQGRLIPKIWNVHHKNEPSYLKIRRWIVSFLWHRQLHLQGFDATFFEWLNYHIILCSQNVVIVYVVVVAVVDVAVVDVVAVVVVVDCKGKLWI